MQEKKPRFGKLKKILQNRRGFIVVVGLSVVALTMYYTIMVQKQMINTVQEIQRNNDLFQAQSVARSVGDFVSYVVDKHEAGFSLDEVKCKYVDGKIAEGSSTHALCNDFFKTVADGQWEKGNNVEIIISVKGNPSDKANEKYGTCVEGLCYGVPAPATGDAGNSTICQAYKETIVAQETSLTKTTGQTMDDIDNPCNWNKLIFGSSSTDRVAIPLYYDNSDFTTTTLDTLKDAKAGETTNPFSNGEGNFILRVRTPCLPCFDKDTTTGAEITGVAGKRSCEGEKSPYYCADTERYVLNTLEKDSVKDDMVVSWQITGKCGEEECGMIQFKEDAPTLGTFSAVLESIINNDTKKTLHAQNKIINTTNPKEEDKPKAKDTTTYSNTGVFIIDELKKMTNPVFSMALSGKLESVVEDQFVPYLEYQFLTNTPIGQAKIETEIVVIVNNVFYVQKLEKAEKRPLIDFAIQN